MTTSTSPIDRRYALWIIRVALVSKASPAALYAGLQMRRF